MRKIELLLLIIIIIITIILLLLLFSINGMGVISTTDLPLDCA